MNIASEQPDDIENSVRNDRISPELIEERIRENLEPLKEQILNLTQLLHQLINDNLAKTGPMVCSRTAANRRTSPDILSVPIA